MSDLSKIETQMKNVYVEKEAPNGPIVKGYDLNNGINYEAIFDSFATMGIQATNLSKSISITNEFLNWRLADEPIAEDEDEELKDLEIRKSIKCKVFLSYTSNMISSGNREYIRYLVQHKLVDAIVSSAGGIEEDFIKCMAPFTIGNFNVDDRQLRKDAINRIGNIYVPSKNYCLLEDWLVPIFDEMYDEQIAKGIVWSPSSIIERLGERINNEDSVYYWAAKNKIPVFCPAITDGAIGDMLFYHSYKKQGFIIDVVQDCRKLNVVVLNAKKSAIVALGGGVTKHHLMNAHIWRNGADYAVFMNTGLDMEASDAGAMPSEGLSWGKLRLDSKFVKIFSEASLIFPIYIAQTFAKYFENQNINIASN